MSARWDSAGPSAASSPPFSPGRAKAVCLALAALAVLADAATPVDLMIPILYAVPVALARWARSRSFLWGLVGVLVATVVLVFFFGPEARADRAIAAANRALSVVTVLMVAGMVHVGLWAVEALDEQRLDLERQNAELETVNEELGQREEEIVRQNEELQTQTEELERQSEELRITNEELVNWQRMLEQLLELSRSLTVDLSRKEVFDKICETLGLLTHGAPGAILEKQDDELVVSCHQGIPGGPRATRLPYAQSFCSAVISLGQSGYLEDTALRPDLHLVQPQDGEPFRSVLSTPLRVHGRSIGAIELYAHEPHRWSDAEVAMLESLAAQASASLQSAELVEQIQHQRRRFEAAFRTVPFGMAVSDDPRGEQIRLNPAGAAMFQVPLDENVSPHTAVGSRLVRQLFRHDQPIPPEQLPMMRALAGEEVHGEEVDLVPPKGSRLVLLCSAAPIYDARGKIAGAVLAFADITPQKALQRELELRRREAEEASIRKTRFLAAVSHDIRTPANAISLMAELIRRSIGDPKMAPELAEAAESLKANTHALIELVGDVLDIARFDSGKVDLIESEFSLGDLIQQEIQQLLPLSRDKGLQLLFDPPARPIWLRTDRVKLGRVLGNLIGNAIKFTEQGTVRVSTRLEEDPARRVVIDVQDTGIGISPEHLNWIFDEFSQLNNPARDRMKGTGLGLSICKRLLDVMGGSISVESEPGNGSCFTVGLPASLVVLRLDLQGGRIPLLEDKLRTADRSIPRLPLRVLLVEDHPSTRQGTARILRDEGANVLEAPDGQTALELLRREPVQVVLLDMMLPDLDGREVLKAIQEVRPPQLLGVLVLTGDLTAERVEEIKNLGADGLIEKPVDLEKLVGAIRAL